MDPDVTLRRIRLLCSKLSKPEADASDVASLLDHIEALDTWLSRGGFLPDAWGAAR